MNVTQEYIGELGSQTIFSFTIQNDHGIEVTAINYGCIITKIVVPDKNGNFENVVLGHDFLNEYVNDPYFLVSLLGTAPMSLANPKVGLIATNGSANAASPINAVFSYLKNY
ncbi:hypothetical protein ACE198_17605 [Neobacillus sp. KR4-4]|uniref:aldose epimerase family protein n=1 Tax=Neobacillus sp. KR4-4 TaxID=3344872 RepID=UPI0035CB6D97